MALSGEQLDKVSLKYVVITPAQKKEMKRQHKRKKRRQRKNVEIDNPQYNRYNGWAG